jgi:transcriptional regulator with XRE-family HTH domain
MNTQTLIKARKMAKISQTQAANYLGMALRTFQRKEINQGKNPTKREAPHPKG